MTKQNNDFTHIITYRELLKLSVVDSRNALGFPNVQELVDQLPQGDIRYVYDRVLEISSMTPDQLEELSMMLEVQFDPQYSEESWQCTICQKKKLDYSRACGFLDESKRDPHPVLPRVGSRAYTECPISLVDNHVLRQVFMASSLMEAGMMPEDGGLGSQTDWFIQSALLYKRKMAEAERAALESARNGK